MQSQWAWGGGTDSIIFLILWPIASIKTFLSLVTQNDIENNWDYHDYFFLPCLYFIVIPCLAAQIYTYHYQTIPNLVNYKTLCIMMSFIPEVHSSQSLLSPYKANEEQLKLLWGNAIQKKSLVRKRVRGLINKQQVKRERAEIHEKTVKQRKAVWISDLPYLWVLQFLHKSTSLLSCGETPLVKLGYRTWNCGCCLISQ